MVQDGEGDRRDRPETKPNRQIRFGLNLYTHTMAVFGALGLAAMLKELTSIEWRSFLGDAVGVWESAVRPVAQWFLNVLVTEPLHFLVGVDVVVPVAVRDYLSVGFILVVSLVRTLGGFATLVKERGQVSWLFQNLLIYFVGGTVLWPYFLYLVLTSSRLYSYPRRRIDWLTGHDWSGLLEVSAPVLYLGLLVAINFTVF